MDYKTKLSNSVIKELDRFNLDKYNFEYLDERFYKETEVLEVELEYTGDDVYYKYIADFDDYFEYEQFDIEMRNITSKHAIDMTKRLLLFMKTNNNNLVLTTNDGSYITNYIEGDRYDFSCIYIYFKEIDNVRERVWTL